jgi:hypothetical protein
VPGPEDAQYPVILEGMPPPQLRVYPRYTVVAEKLEPMMLSAVIEMLRQFLLPVLTTLAADNCFDLQWRAGAGWEIPLVFPVILA